MKRKRIMMVLGVLAAAAVCSSQVMAMTYGYDTGEKMIYIIESPGENRVTMWEDDTICEYGFTESMSDEEKQRLENWHKQQMREEIAYLEKYGVSYDTDKDQILYQGKTVRWLVDEQMDGTMKAIQMPEGEIDLYTERAQDYTLTGVRIASQEEYDNRTREDESTRAAAEAAEAAGICYEETYCVSDAYEDYAEDKRRTEYEQNGIGHDNHSGSWTWNGEPVYWLMDEDGGIYTNNSEEAKKNKIYLLVKRNRDGSIDAVRQMTVEEALAERITWDY